MEKEIRRVRSAKDIIISSLFIVAGIVSVMVPSASMTILGIVLIVLGALLLMSLKSVYIIGDDPVRYYKRTYDCCNGNKEAIISFLNNAGGRFEAGDGTGGLLMYAYINKEKTSGYAQLFEYSQYQYKACTGLVTLSGSQISALGDR